MNEFEKLRKMLCDAKIPFETYQELHPAVFTTNEEYKKVFLKTAEPYGECGVFRRNQIIYGRTGNNRWKLDGICQYGSYGAGEGMIETYGQLGVDNDGEPRILNAEQVFDIIKKDFEQGGKEC